MVVSVNPGPSKLEFDALLNKTLVSLAAESKQKQEEYLTLLGNKFEERVFAHMNEQARGTSFEDSIELISGQKFPDIIANKYYGIEVKTTKQDHWTTTGNSVLEGTRIDGIERIYMLFGKMVRPVEFRCRLYEECLSDVVVTHSPRYQIDMNLDAGRSIFDKLGITYENLRASTNPIRPITDYYRQFLKPGEEVWWLDQDESVAKDLIIKLWNNLDIETRKQYMIKSMVLFPEIFSNRPDKFNKLAIWLVNFESIVCPNVRDVFTAGGQGIINWNGEQYTNIPKIVIKLTNSLARARSYLDGYHVETLEYHWQKSITSKYNDWLNLIIENTAHMRLKFDLKKYIESIIK